MINIVNQKDFFPRATSGALTIPATTAGNVLIILAVCKLQSAKWIAPNFISTSDGNFTEVPFYSLQSGSLWDWGSVAGSAASADVLYQVTTGGVTTINFTANSAIDMICVREVAGLTTPVVVDDFKLIGSAAAVPIVGSALAGSGANDLCFENFATSVNLYGADVTSPWLVDMGLQDLGSGGALFQKGVSGTQSASIPFSSSGVNPSAAYTCVSVAFKGSGAAPTTPTDANGNPVTLKYVFSDNLNNGIRFVDTNNNIHSLACYSNDWTGAFNNFRTNQYTQTFSGSWGITMLGDHMLYLADQLTSVVWEINIITGVCTRICGGGAGATLIGPALDWSFAGQLYTIKAGLDGNLYLGVPGYQTIICINMQPNPITVCGITIPVGYAAEVTGTDRGQGFRSDYSVAVDAAGNIYAAEEGNNTGFGNDIWKTDPTGAATKICGTGTAANTGDGGPATAASLDSPLGLAIDNNNILYIVCNGINGVSGGAIRAINLSAVSQKVCGQTIAPGNIATLAHGSGLGSGYNDLWACAPDNHGNLYVCDVNHSGNISSGAKGWLHAIDANGVYSVVAGSPVGTAGFSGDGGPATSALVGVAFGVGTPVVILPPPPNFPAPPGGDHFTPSASPVAGPVQVIPLDNSPNQTWEVTVLVDSVPVTMNIVLRYNEIAQYWVATIRDLEGNVILDSLPFVTGTGKAQNLLEQFNYLGLGSATIFNASGVNASA